GDLEGALDLDPGVPAPQPLQEEQRRGVQREDRQLVALRVLAQDLRVLAVPRIGDHHLHAVVPDLVGEAERLLDPRGEHGRGGQTHRDAALRVLLAARITRREPPRELLPGGAVRAAGPGVRLAGTVSRCVRRLTVTASSHGTSSEWTGVVSMQQPAA